MTNFPGIILNLDDVTLKWTVLVEVDIGENGEGRKKQKNHWKIEKLLNVQAKMIVTVIS